jgi:hypothetical protein
MKIKQNIYETTTSASCFPVKLDKAYVVKKAKAFAKKMINKYSKIYNGIFTKETILVLAKRSAIIGVNELIKEELGSHSFYKEVKKQIKNYESK